MIPDIPKIESKDHMWKPAPIMGRDFTAREVTEPEVVSTNNKVAGVQQQYPYSASLRQADPM